jgi:integrase
MVLKLAGLVKRGGVWTYRKRVPPKLRPVVGAREIWRSLGTADLDQAQEWWRAVRSEVARSFADGVPCPATEYARGELTSTQGPASRSEGPASQGAHFVGQGEGPDNPTLSVLFARYYAERKLPAKSQLEWNLVLSRIQATCCGDVAVRSVTQAHVRMLKDSLLSAPARRGGSTLSPATVQKNLSGLRAVLGWAKRNGYISSNPAEDFTVVTRKNGDEGRLPYDAADLKVIFSPVNLKLRANEGHANYWLPWLALYTGPRLEELGQLRVTDVREDDRIHFLAIEPGDGKQVKTKSSKRRVPIHPRLIKVGLLRFVESQRTAGETWLFPGLESTSYGSRTAVFSKWWGRHARTVCGITDSRKVWHSFRHLWKDAARSVMPEEHHDAITGHSNGSVGRSYGTGVPLRVLAASVAKVRFSV